MTAKQPKGLAATDLKKDRVYRCIDNRGMYAPGSAVMVYDGHIFPGNFPCKEISSRFVLDEGVRDAKAGIALRKACKIGEQKA